jgi:hypothetical protein
MCSAWIPFSSTAIDPSLEAVDPGLQGLDPRPEILDLRAKRVPGLRGHEVVETLLDTAEALVQTEDGDFESGHAGPESLRCPLDARQAFLDRGDLVFEGEQAVKHGIDLGGGLIGPRIDPRVELVEAPVGGSEPSKDPALELLEDGESERLVRHGEILLLSFLDQVSDAATIGGEGRKGRERPAVPMLAEGAEVPGPFEWKGRNGF